jgi:hypothetical protein
MIALSIGGIFAEVYGNQISASHVELSGVMNYVGNTSKFVISLASNADCLGMLVAALRLS